MPLRVSLARLCLETRTRLGLTQQELGDAVGVTHGYIAKVESARANPSLDLVERIAKALDFEIEFVARVPTVIGDRRQHDLVHARCSSYVERRLRGSGWLTAREVEIVHGRSHGWIDLLAFDPVTGILLVVAIKTRLDDLGSIERQLGWYERSGFEVARRLDWRPRRVIPWLLVLCSEEVDQGISQNRDLMARGFPVRARMMSGLIDHVSDPIPGRGLAMIDPTSKRSVWLRPSKVDGRRSRAPFRDYGDAARRLAV